MLREVEMALMICPECGREVSDQAEACPGCGYPINLPDYQEEEEPRASSSGCLSFLMIVFFVLLLILILGNLKNCSTKSNKSRGRPTNSQVGRNQGTIDRKMRMGDWERGKKAAYRAIERKMKKVSGDKLVEYLEASIRVGRNDYEKGWNAAFSEVHSAIYRLAEQMQREAIEELLRRRR